MERIELNDNIVLLFYLRTLPVGREGERSSTFVTSKIPT